MLLRAAVAATNTADAADVVAVADNAVVAATDTADAVGCSSFCCCYLSDSIFPLFTLSHGRCFKIKLCPDYKMSEFFGVGTLNSSNLDIHLVEDGQELCVKFGTCPDEFTTVQPSEDHFEYWVSVVKSIKPRR